MYRQRRTKEIKHQFIQSEDLYVGADNARSNITRQETVGNFRIKEKQKNAKLQINYLDHTAQEKQIGIEGKNNKSYKQYIKYQQKQENGTQERILRRKAYADKPQRKYGKVRFNTSLIQRRKLLLRINSLHKSYVKKRNKGEVTLINYVMLYIKMAPYNQQTSPTKPNNQSDLSNVFYLFTIGQLEASKKNSRTQINNHNLLNQQLKIDNKWNPKQQLNKKIFLRDRKIYQSNRMESKINFEQRIRQLEQIKLNQQSNQEKNKIRPQISLIKTEKICQHCKKYGNKAKQGKGQRKNHYKKWNLKPIQDLMQTKQKCFKFYRKAEEVQYMKIRI